jgi:hypothetical protein
LRHLHDSKQQEERGASVRRAVERASRSMSTLRDDRR